jgi:hypothetical protein
MTGISCLNFLQSDMKARPMTVLEPFVSVGLNRFLKTSSDKPKRYIQFQTDG